MTSNLLDDCRQKLLAGDNKSALELALQAVDALPTDAEAWLFAGSAHEQMDNYDSAIEMYERALELTPTEKITQRLRTCIQYRYKAAGKKDDGYLKIFTARESAVYDRFLSGKISREVLLKVTKGSTDYPDLLTSAHFGGSPYAEDGDTWPDCPACGHYAQNFVCQLRWHPHFNDPVQEFKKEKSWLISFFHCFCFSFEDKAKKAKGRAHVKIYRQPSAAKAIKIAPTKPTLLPTLDRKDLTIKDVRNHLPDEERFYRKPGSGPASFIPDSYLNFLAELGAQWPKEDAVILGGPAKTGSSGCTQLAVASLYFPVQFSLWCCPDHDNEYTVQVS